MGFKFRTAVNFLERTQSPFAVSRLIMNTGVDVRAHAADDNDDEEAFAQVLRAMAELMSSDDLKELHDLLQGGLPRPRKASRW